MERISAGRSETGNCSSVEAEVHFHIDLDGYRLAVLTSRVEFPDPDCIHGFLVQSHSKRTLHANVVRTSIRPYYDPKHYRTLKLRLAGFFRIFRVGCEQGVGSTYAPAYTIMGGTTQVLRNIMGERVLGLPR